ncbi:MAG TPA: hypothetical protein VFV54_07630 [Thermoanaerobaculia bacterium]|nr:hypothetical protein [Thermoanaerobaculia bacterium]
MKKHLKTTARFVAGIIFLALGVVGSLLPVMQGWIFFLLAALMFFPNHPRAEKGLQKLERRLPRLVGWLRRLGFGHLEDELANLDVKEWVHEHDPFHHKHHPHHPAPESSVQEFEEEERRREAR